MATCWNSSLQSSFQLCFICFVRYIWIYVFCLNDLLFHDFSQHFVQKITPTGLFNASEWHSLSHSFILSIYPYAIWHNGRLQKWTRGETFHLLLHQNEKAKNFLIDFGAKNITSLYFHLQSLFPQDLINLD